MLFRSALVVPQIIWGMSAWAGVAALAFVRMRRGWQARRAAVLSAVSFASVLALYLVFRFALSDGGRFL